MSFKMQFICLSVGGIDLQSEYDLLLVLVFKHTLLLKLPQVSYLFVIQSVSQPGHPTPSLPSSSPRAQPRHRLGKPVHALQVRVILAPHRSLVLVDVVGPAVHVHGLHAHRLGATGVVPLDM